MSHDKSTINRAFSGLVEGRGEKREGQGERRGREGEGERGLGGGGAPHFTSSNPIGASYS